MDTLERTRPRLRPLSDEDAVSDEDALEEADPTSEGMREAMANERTLLAWTRTSVAVIGLGFVVAKLALFLRNAGGVPAAGFGASFSTLFGVIIVILGTGLMIPALSLYSRREEEIGALGHYESPLLGLWTGLSTLGVGILITLYLLVTG